MYIGFDGINGPAMKKHLLIFMMILMQTAPALCDPALSEGDLLSFGEFAVTSNAVQSIVIAPDGSQTVDPGITKLLPGRAGSYHLSSFAASIPVSASVADTTLAGPGGAIFDVTSFTFDPPVPSQTTDVSGNLTIKIGATLSTRAGVNYSDGPYRGTYTLLINY